MQHRLVQRRVPDMRFSPYQVRVHRLVQRRLPGARSHFGSVPFGAAERVWTRPATNRSSAPACRACNTQKSCEIAEIVGCEFSDGSYFSDCPSHSQSTIARAPTTAPPPHDSHCGCLHTSPRFPQVRVHRLVQRRLPGALPQGRGAAERVWARLSWGAEWGWRSGVVAGCRGGAELLQWLAAWYSFRPLARSLKVPKNFDSSPTIPEIHCSMTGGE